MGFPAARLTDMHVCPMVTGIIPHVGGPIAGPGCPTVLIQGLPAARVTDMLICVGPPDLIVKGSAGVMIGGLPAARMLDTCAHGGLIVLGCFTVLIGEAGGGGGGGSGGGGGGAGGGAGGAAAGGSGGPATAVPTTESTGDLSEVARTKGTYPASGKQLTPRSRRGADAFARDASGEIKAVKTGGPFGTSHGGAPNDVFVVQQYELELKNGSKIKAMKSLGRLDPNTKAIVADARLNTDCHGVTFTGGEYWINDDQVDKTLSAGGFKQATTAKPGDVMVYRKSNGEIVHSVTVTKVDANGKPLEVSGLGGLQMSEHADPPDQGWHDPNATQEVWSR